MPLAYFEYEYDAASRISSIRREGGVAIYYEYDAADRLTGEEWKSGSGTVYGFAWDYDRVGNRTYQRQVGAGGGTAESPAETYYEYDAANQLVRSHAVGGDAPGWTYYEHDALGNQTLMREPGGATYFEYNGAGLAESVRFKGGACNYFRYDALMRRSAVEEGAGATYYVWDKDALAPVLARTPSAGAEEAFVRGRAPVPGAGDLAARVRKEGGQAHLRYDIFDHLGNVHLVVDGSGEPVAQRAFNAWGEAIALTGGSEAKRRGQCSPAWRGLPDDPESRYWLTPTHVYDAKAGRFLQRDLCGFSHPGAMGKWLQKPHPVARKSRFRSTGVSPMLLLLGTRASSPAAIMPQQDVRSQGNGCGRGRPRSQSVASALAVMQASRRHGRDARAAG